MLGVRRRLCLRRPQGLKVRAGVDLGHEDGGRPPAALDRPADHPDAPAVRQCRRRVGQGPRLVRRLRVRPGLETAQDLARGRGPRAAACRPRRTAAVPAGPRPARPPCALDGSPPASPGPGPVRPLPPAKQRWAASATSVGPAPSPGVRHPDREYRVGRRLRPARAWSKREARLCATPLRGRRRLGRGAPAPGGGPSSDVVTGWRLNFGAGVLTLGAREPEGAARNADWFRSFAATPRRMLAAPLPLMPGSAAARQALRLKTTATHFLPAGPFGPRFSSVFSSWTSRRLAGRLGDRTQFFPRAGRRGLGAQAGALAGAK